MPGWGAFAEQLAKAGNKLLEHKLKPAVEKLKDMRFKYVKGWIKWKKKSDKEQDKAEARSKDREQRAKDLKL